MASIGGAAPNFNSIDQHNHPNADFSHFDTQVVDSQVSPSLLPENLGDENWDANDWFSVQNSSPFHGTFHIEDGFETQVVDFGNETQVLDDFNGLENLETQLVDNFDQVVLDSDGDGEGIDGTEVLVDGDELSDGESGRKAKCQLSVGEKIQHDPPSEKDEKEVEKPNFFAHKQHNSGSVPRFTSVRIASVRASGMAAHSNAVKEISSRSCSNITSDQFHEQDNMNNRLNTQVEVDEACDGGNFNDEMRSSDGNKSKFSCLSVRNLFSDNLFSKTEGLNNIDSTGEGKETVQFPSVDDGFSGLSYVDSQEPGESTQADAIACVERLIEENKELFDSELNLGKTSGAKSNCISLVKGPQSLAKKVSDKAISGEPGTFDWDDGREDEGGGDIFRRRKEDFFGYGNDELRSFTNPQKPKRKHLSHCGVNEGKSDAQDEVMASSDSKLVSHNKLNEEKEREMELNIRKSLVNEFNLSADVGKSSGQLEATQTGGDVPEMLGIGLDTQLAVEAMEALFNGEGNTSHDVDGTQSRPQRNRIDSPKGSPSRKTKSVCSKDYALNMKSDVGFATRHAKRKSGVKSSELHSSCKSNEHVGEDFSTNGVVTRSKRTKLHFEKLVMTSGRKDMKKLASKDVEKGIAGALQNPQLDKLNGSHETAVCRGDNGNKQHIEVGLMTFAPVAHRTRKSLVVSQLENAGNVGNDYTGAKNRVEVSVSVEDSEVSNAKDTSSGLGCPEAGKIEKSKTKLADMSSGNNYPRGKRSCRNLSDSLNAQSMSTKKSTTMSGHKRSRSNVRTDRTACADSNVKRFTRSSISEFPDLSSLQGKVDREMSPQHSHNPVMVGANLNRKKVSTDGNRARAMELLERVNNVSLPSTEVKANVSSDKSPEPTSKLSEPASTSPGGCVTPENAASPVCAGDGYLKKSCKKNLSRSCLMREIDSLSPTGAEPVFAPTDLRRRRDLTSVRILFSHHLDDDIIKHQKKIADRLKVSVVSSISDATHFVTDKFVRTRNMLEAIASGKPIVTHLWLEDVGQSMYYIDEQKYILRDTKKEKEFGFNMMVSLGRALQRPLLQGRKVLITPNAKPSKEIVSSLAKAVHGQAVERVGRSTLKDITVLDDLLILSCEEDYEECVPFLQKGATVYSSELLLSGIVTQKLEYARHRLFIDHVKRTRSTIWVKKDGRNFIPVTKK